jgi:two-component system, OmpR family, alkaline phosphatase synthesis response regulator PhoP
MEELPATNHLPCVPPCLQAMKTSLNKKKILVIEDELQIRENVKEILEMTGFTAITAVNGVSGLQIAKSTIPDLILCDIMMPDMDGYGVLQELRQDPLTSRLPLIFLTARVDRNDLRQGMELGADDYLTKPFETNELLRAIISRLSRQENLVQQFVEERQQSRKLRQEIQENNKKLQRSQQLEGIKTDLLQKLSQDLREPLSNINMAVYMLSQVQEEPERDRYLSVLQEECAREISILNEVQHLQLLLTPENAQLLQRFRIINDESGK